MTFEWDENKNTQNKRIHDGISFEYAARVFLDAKRIETLDIKHSNDSEERYGTRRKKYKNNFCTKSNAKRGGRIL